MDLGIGTEAKLGRKPNHEDSVFSNRSRSSDVAASGHDGGPRTVLL